VFFLENFAFYDDIDLSLTLTLSGTGDGNKQTARKVIDHGLKQIWTLPRRY
jgi:hypothetical protein